MRTLAVGSALLLALLLSVSIYARSVLVVPAPAPRALWHATIEARFDEATFPEGLEATSEVVVSGVSPMGAAESWLWTRDRGTRRGAGNTLARTQDGRLFVTTYEGPASDPAQRRVRLDELVQGAPVVRARFAPGAAINGIAFGPEDTLYAADSALGCIWSWRLGGEPEVWRADPRFAPASLPGIPGLNGLRIRGQTLWTVNSSSGVLYRLSLETPEITAVARDLPGDGFDLASDGSIYVATHPFNTVERVAPDGDRTVIADASLGVVGPTDVWALSDGSLLVVQDGGAFLDLLPPPARLLFPSARAEAALIRLRAP